jgi:hypothetical protein
MKPTSKKITASAAALFTSAFLMMTAPVAHADDFCIKNGAQAAHGCGYPTMEACRASAAGMGGMCEASGSPGASSNNPSNAMAYQPRQSHSRSRVRSRSTPKAPPANDE